MGFVEKLAVGVGAVVLAAVATSAYKDAKETKRRKESPLCFDEGITQGEFVVMASDAAKRTPRIKDVAVSGMTVTLRVRSNSGLSTWGAEVDFNDYGHLTGTYWINTENSDSIVPKHFAEGLKEQIGSRLTGARWT